MADTSADAPQTNGHPTPSPQTATASSQPTAPTAAPALLPPPSMPSTSATDPGAAKRPRDARLIHMLLSSLGITAYQDRVPLLLLDFAYRHTSSILSDALHLSSDAYISQQTRARDPPAGGSANALRDVDEKVTMNAIQLAIQSRLQYQFQGGQGGGLGKEFLLEMAEQRNKIALPRVGGTEWGVRLPAEKFVLSGVPWGLMDEWEGDEEEETEDADVAMGGIDGPNDKEDPVDGEGVEGGTAGDLFGDDFDDEPMETEDS